MKKLIPKPVSVIPSEETFELTVRSQILVDHAHQELLAIGQYLADQIQAMAGFRIPVRDVMEPIPEGCIRIQVGDADTALDGESYQITIIPQGIELTSSRPVGAFYGVQTLRQLLPVNTDSCEIPCGVIRDYPRFAYRGAMLDVARHFFGVADIKHYIDLLAMYKLNVLHLHLTDDQGWRIEIKSWPNLTAHGGSTAINNDPGGFYTQEQFTDIVDYARSRFITIVPEIDLPGHTNAALASYPELNCDEKAPELYTGMEVGFSSLCIHKEITYQFVEDVIREVAVLTTGPYIHIGGDEAKSTPKEDYIYFIERIEPLVAKYGKQMVGWEEIIECNLSPYSIMQYWTDIRHANLAVQKGVKLLMSPASRTYIDMKYDPSCPLGLDWAGTTSVEKAYTWNPVTEVPGLDESAIVGIEAPLWSETLQTMEDIEFMTFPRLAGIAEIAWSPAHSRNWNEYRLRLAAQGPHWSKLGINFYPAPEISWE